MRTPKMPSILRHRATRAVAVRILVNSSSVQLVKRTQLRSAGKSRPAWRERVLFRTVLGGKGSLRFTFAASSKAESTYSSGAIVVTPLVWPRPYTAVRALLLGDLNPFSDVFPDQGSMLPQDRPREVECRLDFGRQELSVHDSTAAATEVWSLKPGISADGYWVGLIVDGESAGTLVVHHPPHGCPDTIHI